jgi:hypothetical protein
MKALILTVVDASFSMTDKRVIVGAFDLIYPNGQGCKIYIEDYCVNVKESFDQITEMLNGATVRIG